MVVFFLVFVAGAEFLTTNTYQASIEGFQKYLNLNYEESFELIKKSVTLCRQAITEENSGKYCFLNGLINSFIKIVHQIKINL